MLYFVKNEELRAELKARKSAGQTIGLVPTMGALHSGHLSLIEQAAECDVVVATIFVNKLQFNKAEDFEKYPVDLASDSQLIKDKVDVLFAPDADEIYQSNPRLKFDFGQLDKVLEGQFRPGHFNGVAMIVSKLLNIIQPDKAYFGQKDLQQFAVIKTLVRDLSIPTELVACPIIRQENGLALSSRNQRLSQDGLAVAANISVGLNSARDSYRAGTPVNKVLADLKELYAKIDGLEVEYCEVVDEQFNVITSENGDILLSLCVAAYVENVRLIDNVYLRTQN